MSALHQKLQRLKAKQVEVEKQLAAQAAAEHAVVARAFGMILESSSGAYRSAQSSPALDSLSAKDRATFDDWLSRIEQPAATETLGSTQTNQFGSTETHSGSTT